MNARSVSRSVSLLSALIVLAALVAWAGERVEQRPRPVDEANEPIYLPNAKFLRAVSLGYHNVLADALWFRTISYFGEHYAAERTYPWLAHMCDLVTDLDPRAEYVYRFAGLVLPWEAQQADAGIRLLEKGVQAVPESWMLQYLLGFDYYFFKGDLPNASMHLQRAAQLPNVHPQVARLAGVLATAQYGPETALQFLTEMQRTVDNREIREVIQRNIREAKLAADLQQLAAAVAEFRQRFGTLPSSPLDLVQGGVLSDIPSDPFGGRYEIDPQTGAVHSSTGHQPPQLHQSQRRERLLQGESIRD